MEKKLKTSDLENKFCRLYKKGLRLAEIERQLNIHHRQATYWRKKYGFEKSGQRLRLQVSKLWETGVFERQEIAEMLHIPKESVDRCIRREKELAL